MAKLKEWMTWPIAAVLIAGGLLFAAIVIFAPADARAELLGANGLLWTLVASYLRSPRETPPAPTPPVLVMLLAASLTLGMASGCGASAVRTHYDTLAVVAQVFDAATDGAEAALTTQAAACAGDDACLDGVRDAWRPVQVAQGAVLLALQSWASALGLWEAAGDHPAFIRAAIRTLDAVGSGWNTWAESGALVGWTLPAIPPDLLTMARAVGGE